MEIDFYIDNIEGVNKKIGKEASEYIDNLAKPLKSLGELENIAIKLAAITGKLKNNIEKKAIIIFSSDNGIVEEGVASTPQYITIAQTMNFIKGRTGVAVLAKNCNADLKVVDVGIKSTLNIEGVINRKIALGTKNMMKEPAMTREQCIEAIKIGIEIVGKCKSEGYDVIGVGEMGIGNTSTSSAILMVLEGVLVEDAVGVGAGLTKEAFNKKKKVIEKSIEINKPNKEDIIDVVSKVGGFDIAAMIGAYIGAAYFKIPIVIDGFISVIGALCAVYLNPKIKDYMVPSHCSREKGYVIAMDKLQLKPILNLNMALGEGSGCPLAFSIIDYACAMMNNMATFEEAEINPSYLEELRKAH